MDKNTILGFVLIALVLVGFTFYSNKQQQDMERQHPTQQQAATPTNAAPKPQAQAKQDSLSAKVDTTTLFGKAKQGSNQPVILQNDQMKVTVSPKGGVISRVELKEFKTSYNVKDGKYKDNIILFDDKTASMDFTLKGKDENIKTSDYYFTPEQKTDTSVVMTLRAANGASFSMKYVLHKGKDKYMVDYSILSQGLSNYLDPSTRSIYINWQDRARQHEKGFYFESMYSALTYMQSDGSSHKLNEQEHDAKTAEQPVKWVAFKNQYFSAVLIGYDQFQKASFVSDKENEGSGYLKKYQAGMETSFDPTGAKPTTMQFYFGPNKYLLLKGMADQTVNHEDLGLQDLVYLGWPLFKWINRFFTIYVFDWLTQMGLSMGVVLLLITIILRVIVYYPTRKSYMSSAKMRVLKPKIDELAKKYPNKEDAMKKQQETMSLYSQYGVSPMGGCLPMLLQMPIWIAMFNFVPNAFELRQQSFLWADDLSTYDDIIHWSTNLPWIGNHLSLFCVLFCVTNLVYSLMSMKQQKETMSGEQAQQMKMMQWMMLLMPLFFFFMFNKYSAGLNYYYFISLLAGALVMWYLRRTTDDQKLLAKLEANYKANKNNPNKKPSGMAARLEALQKKQEEMMKQNGKK